MNFFARMLAGVFLSYFFFQPVFSQQDTLNPVIITGALSEQYLSDALASVSVITREEIEKSQSSTLADLLQGEAGIEFGRNGGMGSTTSFFLRGQNSKNIAVFIDGVRSPVDQLGALQITDLPLTQIEKIEILRGNASALYGDAAIGGVINIFTRQGAGKPAPFGSVTVGGDGLKELNAGYGGVRDDFKFILQAGSVQNTGFSAMDTRQKKLANPDTDGYENQYFSLGLERKLFAETSIGFRANQSQSKNDYDYAGFLALPADTHQQTKSNDAYVFYAQTKVNADWQTKLDLSSSNINYEEIRNGKRNTRDYGFGLNVGSQKSARWFNTYALQEKTLLNFGFDYSNDELMFTGTAANSDSFSMQRSSRGVFMGMNHALDDWTFQTNVRRDVLAISNKDASSVVTKINPNSTSGLLGIGYSISPQWKLTSSVSNGFSAPTAFDVSQDTKLTPEKFQAKELGFSFLKARQTFRVVYFEIDTSNSIDYADDPPFKPSNAYISKNRGIESTGQTEWNGIRIKASLVIQNPKNVTYEEALGRRAKRYGSIDLTKRIDVYDVGAKIYASGDRKDSHYSADILSSYSVLSVYVSRQFGKNLIGRFKVNNLFDEKYQLAYGYNTPGRMLNATLAYQFQ
jgi:vitamin B12 transporter